MSAGSFITSKYESNSGGIYKARVQPETLGLTIDGVANGAPAGAIDQETSAKMRGGKRKYGVIARTVSLEFTGTVPATYLGTNLVVPVLEPTTYDFYTAALEKTGTYLSEPVKVIGQSPERKR